MSSTQVLEIEIRLADDGKGIQLVAMLIVVPSFLVYAWTCQEKTSIAGPVVALVFAGFSIM